jgi:hypothetical protein
MNTARMRAHQFALSTVRRNAFKVSTTMPLLAVAFFSWLLSVPAAPPGGWFRIAEILAQVEAHARKHAPPAASSTDRVPLTIREALSEITARKLNPTPLKGRNSRGLPRDRPSPF